MRDLCQVLGVILAVVFALHTFAESPPHLLVGTIAIGWIGYHAGKASHRKPPPDWP